MKIKEIMKEINRISKYKKLLWIVLVFFISIPELLAQKVAEQDSLALVAFYNATDGPNWISNQDGFNIDLLKDDIETYYRGNPNAGMNKWLDGPISKWFGVILEKQLSESGTDTVFRVVKLWPVVGRRENGQNKLKGYVPREVGLLTALRYIRIEGNDGFKGTEIPDELYQKTLEELHIEKCTFDGGISDAIRKCTNFKKMNLRYNNFYYMPTLDFMSEANLRIGGTQWIYSTNISYEFIEPTIDYFYSLSPNIQEFGIEARDNTNVGVEREIVAQIGEKVTLKITDAGSRGTVSWYKSGLNTFRKGAEYVIASVKESDYADYFGRCENDYIKSYDLNGNYGPNDTKKINLVKVPVAPVCTDAKSSYDGKSILLYFSKQMAQPSSADAGSFIINNGSEIISVESILRTGRLNNRLSLQLTGSLTMGQNVSISYVPGNVVCANGGVLAAFTSQNVSNFTHPSPILDSVVTTTDGSGIIVTFDKFIDVTSLSATNFTVNDGSDNPVKLISIARGPVNNNISKSVLLTLTNPLDEDQSITLKYNKGKLKALYGGLLNSFDPVPVKNIVQSNRTEVTITFTDGTKSLDNIFIAGSISAEAKPMFDNGLNGDAVAGDHIWTSILKMADGNFNWEIITRHTEIKYDTVKTINEETGAIFLTLTPYIENTDSLISVNNILNFKVADSSVTGTTTYGIADKSIIINLNMINYSASYPGQITNVYLMGINDDWSNGLKMTSSGENRFTITINPYSVGDIIEFNFRNGNVWENESLIPRNYTVKEENNVIYLAFGNFTTSANENLFKEVNLYPNPANKQVTVLNSRKIKQIQVMTLMGKVIKNIDNRSEQSQIRLDVSYLQNGIYLLKMNLNDQTFIVKKLIKN